MSSFQIVQMDPAAAKWLGFAKQQCKRIMDNGTKDFYREWVIEGSTIKVKSYGGTVKVWLISAGGVKIISHNGGFSFGGGTFFTSPVKIVRPTVDPPVLASITITVKNTSEVTDMVPVWCGMPSSRYNNWLCVSGPQTEHTPGTNILKIPLLNTRNGSEKVIDVDVSSINMTDIDGEVMYSFRVGGETVLVVSLQPSASIIFICVSSRSVTYSADVTNDGLAAAPECSDNAGWTYYLGPDTAYVLRITVVGGICVLTRINLDNHLMYPTPPTTKSACSSGGAFGVVWICTTSYAGQVGVVHVREDGTKRERVHSFAEVQAATGGSTYYMYQDGAQPARRRMHVTDTETYTAVSTMDRIHLFHVPYTTCAVALTTSALSVAHYFTQPDGGWGGLAVSFWEGLLCIASDYLLSINEGMGYGETTLFKMVNPAGTVVFTVEFQTALLTLLDPVTVIGSSQKGIYVVIPSATPPHEPMYNQISISAYSVVQTWSAVAYSSFSTASVVVTPDVDFMVWSDADDRSFIQSLGDLSFVYETPFGSIFVLSYASFYCYIPEQRVLMVSLLYSGQDNGFAVMSVGAPDMCFVPWESIVLPPGVDAAIPYIGPWAYEQTPAAKHADWIAQTAAMQPALPP